MVKISCKLVEFCSCCLLLELRFFHQRFTGVVVQLPPYLLIFGLNMLQIAFPGIKVVLIFPTVESPIVFLYYFGLFIEEFALFVFHFILFLIHKLATANITSPDALDFLSSLLFILILPFDSEHPPVFLNYKSCTIFFVAIFLCLVDHSVV